MKLTKIILATSIFVLANNAIGAVISGPIVNPDNNNTYYLLSSSTWTQAENEAINLGGNLVTINDANENDWVYNTFDGANNYLWIGYNDTANEGNYVWSSGDMPSYTNWSPGEPNNIGGLEDFAMMNKSGNGYWNDFSDVTSAGSNGIYGVVEINAVPVPSAVILFSSGILGLLGYAKRKRT